MNGGVDDLWAHHHGQWRDPSQVISLWHDAGRAGEQALRARAHGRFWELLEELGTTVLVSREYEHLVVALSAKGGTPRASYMDLPHPSGIAVDEARGVVHIASTRNPNQILDLEPVSGQLPRTDSRDADTSGSPLIPVRSRFLPGCTYIHDLAIVGKQLRINAVGLNSVGRLDRGDRFIPEWWPNSVAAGNGPDMTRNFIQLNSIAAGRSLRSSYFTASSERPGKRFPGQLSYPVDRRGVVFSGRTGEPMARGLTRPHSARLDAGRLWLANSGYGELGMVSGDSFEPVVRLPGWSRGLSVRGGYAIVGTSRVIPKFSRYAPGVDLDSSRCGIHIVDLAAASVAGSLIWPRGNQIFAVEMVPTGLSLGFPGLARDRGGVNRRSLFYRYNR